MGTPRLTVDLDLPRRSFRLRLALDVGAETLAVAGPSGAGKSSLLRAVAGLERPAAGRIALGGATWFDAEGRVDLAPERRSVGLVFQEYALFPHLTVERNVDYGGRGRARELLERLRIAHLARARPGDLSGGERQRVALARALARRPGVLLLDEPMAALDPRTRDVVRGELRELLRELRLPTLLVSHDFEDAAALADRVAVLEEGRVVQLAAPAELVARPADAFVASLTGANLVEGVARPAAAGLTAVTLDGGADVYSSDVLRGPVGVVVHPSDITLAREAPRDSSLNHITGRVASVVRVGNRARVRVGPLVAEITGASLERLGIGEGDLVTASFKATGTRLVPLSTPQAAAPGA
ncbi:MAG: ABC transporter ATP-binding protein [Actinomycetota bacterium]